MTHSTSLRPEPLRVLDAFAETHETATLVLERPANGAVPMGGAPARYDQFIRTEQARWRERTQAKKSAGWPPLVL